MLPDLKKATVKIVLIRTNVRSLKKKRYDRDCLRAKHSTDEDQLLKRSQGLDQFKVCGKLKVRCTTMFKALGNDIKQLVRILNGKIKTCLSTS